LVEACQETRGITPNRTGPLPGSAYYEEAKIATFNEREMLHDYFPTFLPSLKNATIGIDLVNLLANVITFQYNLDRCTLKAQ
jgi:hypothetical protein